ncbi:SDR family NAD(P)-dependent oxidoreductase [Corynebacterium lubricantis]|uniref:SDR family NAD(P)-dependent oxidoreductase n=1 Tax=Corynebacterium lubricantis TaxID=541095 RepID=UPI00037A5A68|nr:SDR family oxidoreductase [Corynebacterium lubricantis]
MAEKDFAGQSIIVTGGGSGIGRSTALQLAERGAHVIVADLNDSGDAVAEEINAEGGAATAVIGDISDDVIVAKLVEAATANGERIGLVNNAGVMDQFDGVEYTSDEMWERTIRINLTAPFKLMRACVPHMLEAGKGAIVNVGSSASLRGAAAGAAYTSSKHGLVGLTKNAAYMYAKQGIRTNLVAPGGVDTNIMDSIDGSQINPEHGLEALKPVHESAVRSATPESIASGIVFLMSDAAENFNGVIMPSDGGWSAG